MGEVEKEDVWDLGVLKLDTLEEVDPWREDPKELFSSAKQERRRVSRE